MVREPLVSMNDLVVTRQLPRPSKLVRAKTLPPIVLTSLPRISLSANRLRARNHNGQTSRDTYAQYNAMSLSFTGGRDTKGAPKDLYSLKVAIEVALPEA
eukprot:6487491-Prymnesium_polylepis.3